MYATICVCTTNAVVCWTLSTDHTRQQGSSKPPVGPEYGWRDPTHRNPWAAVRTAKPHLHSAYLAESRRRPGSVPYRDVVLHTDRPFQVARINRTRARPRLLGRGPSLSGRPVHAVCTAHVCGVPPLCPSSTRSTGFITRGIHSGIRETVGIPHGGVVGRLDPPDYGTHGYQSVSEEVGPAGAVRTGTLAGISRGAAGLRPPRRARALSLGCRAARWVSPRIQLVRDRGLRSCRDCLPAGLRS